MKKLLTKLSMLIFFISLASGAQMDLPLEANVIRAVAIYSIFSVLILLVHAISRQDSVNMLKAQLEKESSRQNKLS